MTQPRAPAARHLSVLVLLAAAAGPSRADQPLWELGGGVGVLSVPHYRGSEQSRTWVLPVPYLVYRGRIFRSDRDGTRAVLLNTERVDFDLSVGGGPPASSGDDRARAGMPDLNAIIEVGPKLNMVLARAPGLKVELRVPLRAAFTVERHPQHVGWTLSPVVNADIDAGGWRIGLQAGPLAATRRNHRYLYDVAPQFATAERPAYRAGGGWAGWAASASASRRLGSWWLAGFVRTDSVAGASFEASPLVRQRQNTTVGLAASWVFKTSDERVADQR